MRCRNLRIDCLYGHHKSRLYCLRSGVVLQYDYQCGFVYSVCDSVRSRKHLSVDRVYNNCQSRLYGLYCLRSGNVSEHNLYGLSQHGMYFLRRRHILQYHHQRGFLYIMYHLCSRNLRVDGMYCFCQSGVYGLCSRHVLQYNDQCGCVYGLYYLRCWNLSINGLYNIC